MSKRGDAEKALAKYQTIELVLRGYRPDEIAYALGKSNHSVLRLIREELDDLQEATREMSKMYSTILINRVEKLIDAVWDAATVPALADDGTPGNINLDAWDRVYKAVDMLAKLTGAYAPKKADIRRVELHADIALSDEEIERASLGLGLDPVNAPIGRSDYEVSAALADVIDGERVDG